MLKGQGRGLQLLLEIRSREYIACRHVRAIRVTTVLQLLSIVSIILGFQSMYVSCSCNFYFILVDSCSILDLKLIK